MFADGAVSACAAAAECSFGFAVRKEWMFHGEAALVVDGVRWLNHILYVWKGEVAGARVECGAFDHACDRKENKLIQFSS